MAGARKWMLVDDRGDAWVVEVSILNAESSVCWWSPTHSPLAGMHSGVQFSGLLGEMAWCL